MNRITIMQRGAILILTASVGLATAACGDPLIVLGESPGTVRTVIGVGDSAGTRVDSVAVRSRLLNATAAAFNDASSMLYVADRGANVIINGTSSQVARIFSVTSNGRAQLLLDAGGCTAGPLCLGEVTNMIDAPDNTLIIADAVRHRVLRFNLATRTLTLIAGTGNAGNATEGALAAGNPINVPAGVELDANGTLYVSERGSGRVLAIGANGQYRVVAGGGNLPPGTGSTPATTVRLIEPGGLALANGILYIPDRSLHSLFALTLATGQIQRIAGDGVAGITGDNGSAVDARLAAPQDVALNKDASLLYIADTGNNRVRTLNTTTGMIQTYMGSGATAYNGDRVAAGAVALKTPVSLEASDLGYIFVVDQGHAIIRRVTTGF